MSLDLNKFDNNSGLVREAMAFLAGYGVYICVCTDRLVGRMLDNHARQHRVSGRPLIGLFNANLDKKNQGNYRVGYYANTIRIVIGELINKKVNRQASNSTKVWKLALHQNNTLSIKICT